MLKVIFIMKFIKNLPLDIILQIIPYTYNVQNNILLQDIINYTKIKNILLQDYFNYWIIQLENIEPEDKNWLINDIYAYINDDYPTMLGYVDNFYNILKRNLQLHTIEDVDRYILYLDNKNINSQINIFIGLLQPNERKLFIDFIGKKYLDPSFLS